MSDEIKSTVDADETLGRLLADFSRRERGERTEAYAGSFPIVALGGSARATDDLRELVARISPATGMAFVIVARSAPGPDDHAMTILSDHAQIPVREAEHDLRIEPNHLYVIPPQKYLGLALGTFKVLTPPSSSSSFRPIDFFLRCLAEDQAHLAIAVVVGESDEDGPEGLRAVRALGGLTIGQRSNGPGTDGFDSAAATGAFDKILPVDQVALELERIGRSPLASQTIDPLKDGEMALQNLFSQIKRTMGVDFSKYKRTTIARRLRRRMLLHEVKDLWEYQRIIVTRPDEIPNLARDFMIGVTSFFRDPAMFDELRRRVLPKMLRDAAADNRTLRFWVPGCSTGEEAYSLAICILETQAELGVVRPVQIFASDTNEVSLGHARAGLYSEAISADVGPDRLRRYFTSIGGGHQVTQSVRELCIFANHDVTVDPPFSRLDGVSCRNLLIYLVPAYQRSVIATFAYALNVDGVLILGSSETVGGNPSFTSLDESVRMFLNRGSSTRSSPERSSAVERSLAQLPSLPRRNVDPGAHRDREINRALIERYAPAGVVVDAVMNILQFRGATGEYLEGASGEASLNLFKMLRPGMDSELRILLKRAGETGRPDRRDDVIVRFDQVNRPISIEVIPVRLGPDEIYHIISFEPRPATAFADSVQAPTPDLADDVVHGLRQELGSVKHHLQSIIREQEANHAQLQSAHEEVLCSNEELQSINEEMQTAKEELQSTNEELSTVNDELLIRNEQLHLTSNDLSNLLASVNLPIVMVGQDLRLRRFTPVAEKLLNLLPTDLGRPITQIRPNIDIPNLEGMVAEAIDAMHTTEIEIKDKTGHVYLLRIRPYRTASNQIDGAVIVLIRYWRDESGE